MNAGVVLVDSGLALLGASGLAWLWLGQFNGRYDRWSAQQAERDAARKASVR